MVEADSARTLDVNGIDAAGADGRGGTAGSRRRLAGAIAVLAACAGLCGPAALARDPEPLRVPLDPMGYQASLPDFMLAGASMLTVDFVDKDHLLVSFGVRRLMKREADDPPDDDDHSVAAFLVELPTGKVLARTEWRMHDRSQYLWKLGHGHFLLRVRNQLTTFAPMGDPADAFREVPFLTTDRHVVVALVSSNEDLLTLETAKGAVSSAGGQRGYPATVDPTPVEIDFYRLAYAGPSAEGISASFAGRVRTGSAVSLPMTAAGLLDVIEGGKDRWLFNFDAFSGDVNELAEFDTTCFPRSTFVGHGEFVAFGCRGSADHVDFAGFNLKGEEMWQQNMDSAYVSPTVAFAPAAGRFALGRTLVSAGFNSEFPLIASTVTAQEVRVYQTHNGRQLLRVECSPIERAGQNFALSGDGLRLAVVRQMTVRHPATKSDSAYTDVSTAVEVYPLPPLTDTDQAGVKAAEAMAPADTGARIDLALQRMSASAKDSPAATGTDLPVPAEEPSLASAVGTETVSGNGSANGATAEGDPEPTAPRKPPTLYGPDEKPGQKPQ